MNNTKNPVCRFISIVFHCSLPIAHTSMPTCSTQSSNHTSYFGFVWNACCLEERTSITAAQKITLFHVILFIAIRNLNYTLPVFPIKRRILFRGCIERKWLAHSDQPTSAWGRELVFTFSTCCNCTSESSCCCECSWRADTRWSTYERFWGGIVGSWVLELKCYVAAFLFLFILCTIFVFIRWCFIRTFTSVLLSCITWTAKIGLLFICQSCFTLDVALM